MDGFLLRWHIKHCNDTLKALAEALNLHVNTLYLKMQDKGHYQFTQNEISVIAKRYKLTGEQIIKIFFNDII